jgi:hypothetical protein
MEAISKQSKNPLTVGIVGLVVGTLFGLVVLGWWLWPVQWVNATPAQLSPEWQAEYMVMTIQAFGQTGDVAIAKERYAALDKSGPTALAAVKANPQGLSSDLIAEFEKSVTGTSTAAGATPAAGTTPVAGQTGAKKSGSGSLLGILIAVLCILFLALIGFLAYMFIFRGRSNKNAPPTPATMAAEARKQTTLTDYASTGSEPPIAQFMASYKLGDDLFDDSFSIDSPSGEFLGECGVGISQTIGVGDPKKVTAFEVWLFDKNDIQTVTKVLMSAHAFGDQAIRQNLEAKGEPVLLEPGSETVLETQTLQLVARVVDMTYGEGAMPAQSYFDHLLLELAIWPKAA